MTKTALKAYIQKDLKKLERERKSIKPSRQNEVLRNYIATRLATLKEISTLLP